MCFINYIKAGYPILWVKSHEEHRVLVDYVSQLSKLKYKTFVWDIVGGIHQASIKNGLLATSEEMIKVHVQTPDGGNQEADSNMDPLAPLRWLDEEAPENTLLFLKDYTPFLQKDFQDSTLVKRKIRNIIDKAKSQGKTLAILSSDVQIPSEMDKEITVVEFKLPTRNELKLVLKGLVESVGATYPTDDEDILDSALGMTAFEAENAFSVAYIESQKFNAKIIRREKSSIVKKTGLLEIIETGFTLDDIGGLEVLKSWLVARKDCFTEKARKFGVTPPKGMLLVGVPGCGKSLTAKAVASAWSRPLLRLDVGRIFGSYVGESENNMHKCLSISEAVSPCIIWIDEAEKGLSGNKAGMESHETTRRVFQQLLTWMQEKTADVFVFMTANSVESLPPELLRPGRIDTTFWIDLPDEVQREEIFRIHLKKAGRKPELFDNSMDILIKACAGFSGAEVEVWIKEALVRAFSLGHTELTVEDLLETVKDITPISKLMKNDIDNARKWAESRGTKNASLVHKKDVASKVDDGKRKLNLGSISLN